MTTEEHAACWKVIDDAMRERDEARADRDEQRRIKDDAFGRIVELKYQYHETVDMLGRRIAECDAYQARGIEMERELAAVERDLSRWKTAALMACRDCNAERICVEHQTMLDSPAPESEEKGDTP